jgi:hypothetical protein
MDRSEKTIKVERVAPAPSVNREGLFTLATQRRLPLAALRRSYSNSEGEAKRGAGGSCESRGVKNSSHSVWPIISELEPASRSGITNSPTIGMKHNSAPAQTPGSDSGNVTSQNARCGEAPRSLAASSSAGSILASVA